MPTQINRTHDAKPRRPRRVAHPVTPPAAPPGKVYGYCRVSTGQQAEEGESLEVQQRTIAGYAQMHGLAVERVFIERGVSGSKSLEDRPRGSLLVAALRPGDTVIAPKLDRMFRSALDALQVAARMRKDGISLHLLDLGGNVSTDGAAKAFFTMASAFAELERDRTKERITEVKRDQRNRGRFLGGTVPFGYQVLDGNLVPIPAQMRAIRVMQQMRDAGLALRVIAEKVTKAGQPISHQGVKKALLAAAARAKAGT